MTSIPEKKDGSNLTREDLENKSIKSEFAKKEKFCKFCGKELEQRCWRANGITKYFPVWQECDCEQAQAAKQREIEEQENQERQAKLAEAGERRNKRIKKLLGESGMTPRAKNCQFEGYQLNIANENAFKICKNYSENFNQLKNQVRNGLFLAGPCGVGKSHLAFSIANFLINKGKAVISMTMIDLLMNIKNSYSVEKMTEKDILKILDMVGLSRNVLGRYPHEFSGGQRQRIGIAKALSLNPKFIRAHQLLALLYINSEEWERAKRELTKCLEIDTNNTATLRYLKEVDEMLLPEEGVKNMPKKKKDEVIKYQSGNETIIQPVNMKEGRGVTSLLNLGIGLAIGIAIAFFLILQQAFHLCGRLIFVVRRPFISVSFR